MRLHILLPARVLIDEETTKVIAEAHDGFFCLLPRHVDFVTALVPGIITYETPAHKEAFVAVDEGVLVKCGQEVTVSSRNAVQAPNLEELQRIVEQEFENLDEQQKLARSAVAKIEVNFVRRFLEIQRHGG